MAVIKVSAPPLDSNPFTAAWGYFTTILTGLRFTAVTFLKQLFGLEKTNTLEWPEKPSAYSDRFKGKHFLTLRDDGQVRCTACFLCATNCPAQCIHIEAGQHPEKEMEKYPVRFEIDILRCVFCGFCEEACPVDAIRLGPEYAMAGLAGEKWVYTKEYLAKRPALQSGMTSVKDENDKHPTTDKPHAAEDEIRSYVQHGNH